MKKEYFYFLSIFFSFSVATKAQFTNWQWAKEANSSSDELGWDVYCDNISGTAYVAGSFEGGLSSAFGSSFSNTAGQKDGFVAKFSSAGAVIWAFKIGGIANEEIKGITGDPYGNIYVVGNYNSTTDFDPSPASYTLGTINGGQDGFLAKYSQNGSLIWAVKFGNNNSQEAWKVYADSSAIYISGSYNSSATFYSTNAVTMNAAAAQSGKNFYGAKYNSSGVVQWVISGGSSKDDEGMDVVADRNRVYFTGYYKSTLALYNSSGTPASTLQISTQDKADAFTVAYDQSGSLAWATNAASQDEDIGHGITQDINNIYIAGSFRNNTIYFPYPSSTITKSNHGGQDIFVACISKTNGSYQWVSTQTGFGNNDEEPYEIDVDNNGNLVVSGYFDNTLNFSSFGGPIFSSAGNEDIFITGLNTSGNFLWALEAGGSSTDISHGMSVSSTGEIYITGNHSNSAVFGTTVLNNASGQNFFIAKTGCAAISNNTLQNVVNICQGSSVVINGSIPVGVSSYSYAWQQSTDNVSWTGVIGTGTSQNYSTTPLTVSTFYRRLVISTLLCTNSAFSNAILAKVDSLPSKASAGPDLSVCSSSVNLSAAPLVSGTGLWSVIQGTATLSSPNNYSTIVSALSAGTTILRWQVSNGVCSPDYDDIIIKRDLPPDTASAGQDQQVYLHTAQFSASTPTFGTGYWSLVDGSGTISNINDPQAFISGLSEGNNIFRWHVKNGSCPENTDDVTIYVLPLEIPNGFSPNEDGVNDHFEIPSLEHFSNVKLTIYNRWGGLVYHTDQYKNTWKGTNMSNERLADDTYYYTLEVPAKKSYSGFIILKKNK